MKYILSICFLALFTGCNTSANRTAGAVCEKLESPSASLPVISISLADRTGGMLTW